MWQKATTFSSDASTALSVRVKATEWLSERLEENETALVSLPEVYCALNPKLHDKLVDYHSLWDSVGIEIGQRGYREEVLKVRRYLIDYLGDNPLLKYAVRDWGDPYSTYLYGVTDDDELMFLLREVETFPFVLSTGWSSEITIYERVQYATLFYMDLSSPPKQFSINPRDTPIQYDYINMQGASIQKVGPRVGFYLPLEGAINASRQTYLSMGIRLDVKNLELTIIFYYDKNRDGEFSGYDIDYVKGASFNQTQQGWVRNKWYTICQVIPQSDDPVVQIAIIMTGDQEGSINLRDLIVKTEVSLEVVFFDASRWFSENLKGDEIALVPTPVEFYMANPELKLKLFSYRSLWYLAGVIPSVNITKDEILKVRSFLVNFLDENPQIKYIVRDGRDPYTERLYRIPANDELMFLLREVETIPFISSGGWSGIIVVYEKIQYITLSTMNFSSPPKHYFVSPSDVPIRFDSNGTSIQKVGPRVGFYLPLEGAINASRQTYFTMEIKPDVDNLDLIVVFYCDKDGDGKFSGYDVDYVKSVTFSQTEQGWVKGEWYKIGQIIPKADAPIVQIGIILTGDKDGTLTLANLVVRTEVTYEV